MPEAIESKTVAQAIEDDILSIEEEFRRLERAAGDQQARLKQIAQSLGADPLAGVYHELVGVVELHRGLTTAVGGNLAWLDERLGDLEEDVDAGAPHGESQLTAEDAALFQAGYEQTLRFLREFAEHLPVDGTASEQRAILETLIQLNADRLARVQEIALSPEESEEEDDDDDAPGADDDEPEA